MKKALITGVTGQEDARLAELLLSKNNIAWAISSIWLPIFSTSKFSGKVRR